ncbi:MAG: hypothetical protein LQ342_003614 [Letrouitia transgressa]|nr:MAG: hypothetical protein LQ342_003614 [Letrouitia transgressa]
MESYRQFSQVCALGDLTKVAKFVDLEPRTQQYLNEGLCAAIYKKDVRIVELLISKVATIDPDVANAAATTKLLPIFQLLLEHGWDINAPVLGSLNHPDVRQSSRLRIIDDEQLVQWFLEHGAQLDPPSRSINPSAAYIFRTTLSGCIDIAASSSSIAVLDLLFEHGAKKGDSIALHMAAGSGTEDERVPMMAHLIELGYDVNATDEIRGNHAIGTPLQYAVMAKSLAKAAGVRRHAHMSSQKTWAQGPPARLTIAVKLLDDIALLA